MAKQSAYLSGAAGLGGVDAEDCKHWPLQFGVYLEKFWKEMADCVTLLSNSSPIYVMYHVANSARMLAVDKQSGVRPSVCCDIHMRLWGRCCLAPETKALVRDAYGNIQPCTGLQSGIEGNVHTIRTI